VKNGIGRQVRSLIGRASVEQEVDGELAFHLEVRARELVEGGMDPGVVGDVRSGVPRGSRVPSSICRFARYPPRPGTGSSAP
jgi:hypothetical protein